VFIHVKGVNMSNLIEIQSQIEKLTKQASEIKAREFDKTVEEILAKMVAFGISANDLKAKKSATSSRRKAVKALGGASKKAPAKPRSKAAGVVVAAKFKGPNGESWSGRGLTPRWLSALVASGRTKEEFAVKS
jgi:DNA-binding protein H-NS